MRKSSITPTTPLAALLLLLACLLSGASAQPAGGAVQLTLDGVIGPASADYFVRGLAAAVEEGAGVVVLRIDTPGGLDTSMRDIVRAIMASPIPVLGYVAPGGARAASAGTFILYACHVAAMAPATNLGAATPVAIGGGGLPGGEGEADQSKGEEGAKAESAGMAKATNDAIAYIRSLAELRGRNVEWAEAAVREAASLSARQALEQGVIDLIVANEAELLAQADGRKVRLAAGEVTIASADLSLRQIEPDLRNRLLAAISHPNIAVILLMIGVYGLLFEFMNPGALYPGTIGAICLLVGLFALSALPINYAGAALLVLGIALMVAEAFTPSVGALGIGGAIAFVLGATLLVDTDEPAFAISLPLVAGVGAAGALFALLVGQLVLRSWQRPGVSGVERLLQSSGEVLEWQGEGGYVRAEGERWRATGPAGLVPGMPVRIDAVDGLTLRVAPAPANRTETQTNT